jgi:hypothetical protein
MAGYTAFLSREMLIQEALPDVSPADREQLMTGICNDCWAHASGMDCDDPDEDDCTCRTYGEASIGGDGYGGGTSTDTTGCPIHGDEPTIDDEPPPDYGPPGSGAVIVEYD